MFRVMRGEYISECWLWGHQFNYMLALLLLLGPAFEQPPTTLPMDDSPVRTSGPTGRPVGR
jgi:hypothetical protein